MNPTTNCRNDNVLQWSQNYLLYKDRFSWRSSFFSIPDNVWCRFDSTKLLFANCHPTKLLHSPDRFMIMGKKPIRISPSSLAIMIFFVPFQSLQDNNPGYDPPFPNPFLLFIHHITILALYNLLSLNSHKNNGQFTRRTLYTFFFIIRGLEF